MTTRFNFIKIVGADAANFLQGQLTINLTNLANGEIRYCAQCDAKGKMVGLGYLFALDDAFYFFQPHNSIHHSLAQFTKFGVFAKVEFSLCESQTIVVSEHTPQALETYEIMFETPPLPNLDGLKLTVLNNPIETTSLLDSDILSLRLVKQGVAILHPEMSTQWVPQMLNVQALNGIDFDKGCYMGQEVVARTKYLGKNKRALFTFYVESAANISIGGPLYRKIGDNWRKSGNIINVHSAADKTWLSAVLPNDIDNKDIISLDETGTLIANHYQLPYVVESETSSVKRRKSND